jgi:hypothetical protein
MTTSRIPSSFFDRKGFYPIRRLTIVITSQKGQKRLFARRLIALGLLTVFLQVRQTRNYQKK